MNLDDYLNESAPAGDQRSEDDFAAMLDLLSCLSRAAVDVTASHILAGEDIRDRVAIRLGDTLWYVAAAAGRLKRSLSAIAGIALDGAQPRTFDAYARSLGDGGIKDSSVPVLLNSLSKAAIDSTSGYVRAERNLEEVANSLSQTLRYITLAARSLAGC